jgi:hypothetical protein
MTQPDHLFPKCGVRAHGGQRIFQPAHATFPSTNAPIL